MTIEDYWRIDDIINNKWGKQAYKFIDYCGLGPVRPMANYGYFCTPKNSKTFAATSGNGVHFGLVDIQNSNFQPVVMTVPMAEENNVVVAENLEEFFSLGYFVGWFALEQIAYDLNETVSYFSIPDPELSSEEKRFLEIIRSELNIAHRPLSTKRLKFLKKKYFQSLDIGELDDWHEDFNG